MKIEFKNGKLRKICENKTKLDRLYGSICAKRIIQRINELEAADNLYDISILPQTRLHLLKQNWKGHYSVDIEHPYRIFFLPSNGSLSDKRTITGIRIINIHIDPH